MPGRIVRLSRRAALSGLLGLLGTDTRRLPIYARQVRTFYRPEMALAREVAGNYSRSPRKPRLFLEYLRESGLADWIQIDSGWPPFASRDFEVAHTRRYVRGFFDGRAPWRSMNLLEWSREFAQTVRFTNAALYRALRTSVSRPGQLCLAPVSGFHHARPAGGDGYCTFSGQVIASVKVYRETGRSGAWIDLDGHFGNSIEDSRAYVPDLDRAVPPGCNVNPRGQHAEYLADLRRRLIDIRRRLLLGQIHYVAVAHGADSHEWDDLSGQCTTAEWLLAARLVYGMVASVARELSRPIPLVMSLFGGYREDHYDSVLALHAADLSIALELLCGQVTGYRATVRPPTEDT